jgi:hypothetical protein
LVSGPFILIDFMKIGVILHYNTKQTLTRIDMQRYLLTVVSAAVLLAGCNQDQQQTVVTAVDAADTPSFFETVPAETPYLYATLEPTPSDLIDHFIGKAQPMLDKAQVNLSTVLEQIGNDQGKGAGVAKAILEEFDGKLSREGFESIGLSLEANVLAYGYGPFPVIRLGIGDATAINAFIGRVMQKAGLEAQPQSLNGADYWRFDEEEMGFVAAVLDDHIVFSVLPSALVDARLPELLNQQQPANTLDVTASINALNAENGYTPHGSGYLDFAAVTSLILEGDSPEAQAIKAMTHMDEHVLSEQCKAEIRAIAGQFERLETGYTELSKERMGFNVALDLEDSLASQLAALTVAGIGFNSDPGGLTSFAFGVDIMQMREWALELVAGRIANPYQCEEFQGLNQQFTDVEAKMNKPIPPFVGNFLGIRGRLDDVDLSTGSPTNLKGVVALATSNPEMLIGMAQMFLPSMAELTVTKNAEPVALPLEGLPVPAEIENPHVAMSNNGIGISLGAGSEAGLTDFLSNNGSDTGTIFALGYDFGFYMSQISGTVAQGVKKPIGEIVDADTMAFYTNLIDRQYSEVRLTTQGIEASQVISFK